MSWIDIASDPSGASGKLTVLDIVAGCRPLPPILPDSAYYSLLVTPIRDNIRQLHAAFHPLCHIGVVSPTGEIPNSMKNGTERLMLVDCKQPGNGVKPPEDVNLRMQFRIEQLKRCMNHLARSCAELDIEFHRSDFLLQYLHNCKQDPRLFGGYALTEIHSLQLQEYQTRNTWSKILQQTSSRDGEIFDTETCQKIIPAMYRVLVYSTTIMRLASIAEFAVGECESFFKSWRNPAASSSHKKTSAKESEVGSTWPGSRAKSDCFDWAQDVSVVALTGSPLDRAVGDFCVKVIRSAEFPLNASDDVSDLESVLRQLLSDDWLELLLPPGTCRIEYTDYKEKGFIQRLVAAVDHLRKTVDDVVDSTKADGGHASERKTRSAIVALWRDLRQTSLDGYLHHFGSFVAQYPAVVQKPLGDRLRKILGQEVRVDLPAMNLHPLYPSGHCLRLVELQRAKVNDSAVSSPLVKPSITPAPPIPAQC
ncbi:hypothetical protein FOL47_007405 [Perkinsus chesapeaki]|uniref:Uncharacterized protein n=1 Tax=Perkinsus chesapeaki TaxID=330153 RepID=A0A7J6LKQ0_PERCH|nr:hypothetical protein FOL47_007405 [Perkinsus chesapeaki]